MNRLSSRIGLSHVGAVTLGIAVALVTRWLLGSGAPMVAIAVVAGLIVGSLVGVPLTRWALRPVDRLTEVTHEIARGDYRRGLAPAPAELTSVSTDVAALASTVMAADERRVRLISAVAGQMLDPVRDVRESVTALGGEAAAKERATVGVRRLERLTNDLATLSRVEEGQLDLSLTHVDLAGLARDAVADLEHEFGEAGVKLHALAPGKAPVSADPQRLREVLANLLENALRATCGRENAEVLVGVARKSDHGRPVARLTITDNGVGLSDDELPLVFDRFYRTEATRDSEGTGIGLTVARSIVRAQGGDLIANSPGADRGVTLTLTLPLARP